MKLHKRREVKQNGKENRFGIALRVTEVPARLLVEKVKRGNRNEKTYDNLCDDCCSDDALFSRRWRWTIRSRDLITTCSKAKGKKFRLPLLGWVIPHLSWNPGGRLY